MPIFREVIKVHIGKLLQFIHGAAKAPVQDTDATLKARVVEARNFVESRIQSLLTELGGKTGKWAESLAEHLAKAHNSEVVKAIATTSRTTCRRRMS